MDNVTSWRVMPAREARYGDFPAALDPRSVKTVAELYHALETAKATV